jgi:hypothetical protein
MWLCGIVHKVFNKDCEPKGIYGFLSQGENDVDSYSYTDDSSDSSVSDDGSTDVE